MKARATLVKPVPAGGCSPRQPTRMLGLVLPQQQGCRMGMRQRRWQACAQMTQQPGKRPTPISPTDSPWPSLPQSSYYKQECQPCTAATLGSVPT